MVRKRSGKATQHCPHCGKRFRNLKLHIAKTHFLKDRFDVEEWHEKHGSKPSSERSQAIILPPKCLKLPQEAQATLRDSFARIEMLQGFQLHAPDILAMGFLKEHIRRLQRFANKPWSVGFGGKVFHPNQPMRDLVSNSRLLEEAQTELYSQFEAGVFDNKKIAERIWRAISEYKELGRVTLWKSAVIAAHKSLSGILIHESTKQEISKELNRNSRKAADSEVKAFLFSEKIALDSGRYEAWKEVCQASRQIQKNPNLFAGLEFFTLMEKVVAWGVIQDIAPCNNPFEPLLLICELGTFPVLLADGDRTILTAMSL